MGKLDKDYFYGQLQIADVTNTAVEKNLLYFIAMYEETFLELLLGKSLYDAYKVGIAVLPTPAAKWTALDQQLYQISGIAPNQTKLSPAAHYVYWFWMRDQVTQTTASGEKILNPDKSISVGNAQKVKLAWNAMVTRNRNIQSWIKTNVADYPEWVEPVWDTSTEETKQLYKDRVNIIKTLIPHF